MRKRIAVRVGHALRSYAEEINGHLDTLLALPCLRCVQMVIFVQTKKADARHCYLLVKGASLTGTVCVVAKLQL
jgi:hypothetical protein